jgi:hypothetical protein
MIGPGFGFAIGALDARRILICAAVIFIVGVGIGVSA